MASHLQMFLGKSNYALFSISLDHFSNQMQNCLSRLSDFSRCIFHGHWVSFIWKILSKHRRLRRIRLLFHFFWNLQNCPCIIFLNNSIHTIDYEVPVSLNSILHPLAIIAISMLVGPDTLAVSLPAPPIPNVILSVKQLKLAIAIPPIIFKLPTINPIIHYLVPFHLSIIPEYPLEAVILANLNANPIFLIINHFPKVQEIMSDLNNECWTGQ